MSDSDCQSQHPASALLKVDCMHRYNKIAAQEGYSSLKFHWQPKVLLQRVFLFQQSPFEIVVEPNIYLHKLEALV